MMQYLITNTIDNVEVRHIDGSLFFYVKIKYAMFGAGKRTLTYYNVNNEIFFTLEKYCYLIYFKKKVLLNKLNYKSFFYKDKLSYVLSFEERNIRLQYLDNVGKEIKIYLNNIDFGNATRTSVSTVDIKYSVCFKEDSQDNLLSLVSLCSDFNFTW